MKARKHLSADGLFRRIRDGMARIIDHRPMNVVIPLVDALMSGLALFALKDPSLLAFDQRRATPDNLQQIFGIGEIPSDTQMRTILDDVDPESLRPLYKDVFNQLQRGKALEEMVFMDGYYLASVDGTTYFSSPTVHCESCLERQHRDGSITYSHQMLGAVIVHPEHKTVIPLAPEPIIKQDGVKKTDTPHLFWAKRGINGILKLKALLFGPIALSRGRFLAGTCFFPPTRPSCCS